MMFSIQRLINEAFEIYSKEVSERLKILSPKRVFLARNIGKYRSTDYLSCAYLLIMLHA